MSCNKLNNMFWISSYIRSQESTLYSRWNSDMNFLKRGDKRYFYDDKKRFCYKLDDIIVGNFFVVFSLHKKTIGTTLKHISKKQTGHKLWTEICAFWPIFKGDLIKFCEILTKITLKLYQNSQMPLFKCQNSQKPLFKWTKLMEETKKCDFLFISSFLVVL